MKNKKVLFLLVVLSLGVLLSLYWINSENNLISQAYAGYRNVWCSKRAGWCWKADRSFGAGGCRQGACILEQACLNLPGPCCLLYEKEELGLNAGQIAGLRQLKTRMRKKKVRQLAEIQMQELELQELLEKTAVDKKAVQAQLEAIGSLRAQVAKDCVNTRLEARELLSAEQLKKWEAGDRPCDLAQQISCWKNARGGKI